MKIDFRERLLEWNKTANKREMPWKGETNPYRIWLSEIILQQTRVEQGLSYYHSFISQFPTVYDLANAPEEQVFKLWEGLGYYSRCKNLIASARYIVKELNGRFPESYEAIKLLKGVGPYTASAIASFAYNLPHAVVDGNVQRVLARYFGISTPIDTTAGKKFYQELATSLMDEKQPAIYNQAIMDFGAIICKPQNPACENCPQQKECEAFAHGLIKDLPVKEKKLVKKHRWFYYFIIETPSSVFIRKRTARDIWENLHEFALEESNEPTSFPHHTQLIKILGKQSFVIVSQSRVYVQQLTHQTIHGQFIQVSVPETVSLPAPFVKVNKDRVTTLAFPRLINNYLEEQQF